MRRAYVVCLIQILIQLSATTLPLCQSNRVPPLSPIANGVSPISVHEALTRDGSGKFPPSFEAGQWQPDGLVNSLSFAPWPPFGSRLHPGTSSGVFPTQPRNSRNRRIKAPRAAGASIFEMAATYDSGGGAVSVAVGDFKGDGKLDLVVANGSSDTVAFCWATATELSKRWCPTDRWERDFGRSGGRKRRWQARPGGGQ